MKLPGTYKIASRRSFEAQSHPALRSERRVRRIVESLREQILDDGVDGLRIRCIFRAPREIWRLEIEMSERGYQRMTLLDRDTLEDLLSCERVRSRMASPPMLEG